MTTFNRGQDFKTMEWGLSMSGGWYINFFNNGENNGVGGKTLKECLTKLGLTRADLRAYMRRDN